MLLSPRLHPALVAVRRRALAADLLLLAVLVAASAAVITLAGVARVVEPVAALAAVLAAVVLVLAGTMDADRSALLIAAAVGPAAACALLPPAVGGRDAVWQLLGGLGLLAVAALLAATAGPLAGRARVRQLALGLLGAVLLAMATVAVVGALRPGWTPAAGTLQLTGVAGRVGLAAAAIALVVAGADARTALSRRTGLALLCWLLATPAAGSGRSALTAAAAALLLVAALGQLRPVPRPMSPRHPARRPGALRPEAPRSGALRPGAPRSAALRPAALRPEAPRSETPRPETPRPETPRPETPRPETPRSSATRSTALRSGAVRPGIPRPAGRRSATLPPTLPADRPLTAPPATARPAPGPAAGDVADPAADRGVDAPADPPPGGRVAVAAVADDLAVLYRSIGLDVRVEVHGDPWVGIDRAGLAQLLANLLANCARHAPGAQVRVRAAARGPRVRIEVIDNGPGLPPGSSARLLRRGVRGPGSTGAGLGLAICTELVERSRGTFTVVSTAAGCTALVELPTAWRPVSAQAVSA